MKHIHYYTVNAKTHFELGFGLGKLFKSPSLDTYHRILSKTPHEKKLIESAQAYLRITNEFFPSYVEELRGYAKALQVDFLSFWTSFLNEEMNTSPEKCTSCFTNNGLLVGHNEDFSDHYNKRICILRKTINDVSIIELYYYDSLGGTAVSVNSNGYVQTINTLNHVDTRIGVPRNIIARWLSETDNPEKDFSTFKTIVRSLGYSHTFTSKKKRIINLESTANAAILTHPTTPYVHTNHYFSSLSAYEDTSGVPGNSLERYTYAINHIRPHMSTQDMCSLLEEISALPSNKKRMDVKTIARAVIDLEHETVLFWLKREKQKGWISYPL